MTGPVVWAVLAPGPDLRAELMMSGMTPPGGRHNTRAVLPDLGEDRYLERIDSGNTELGVLIFLRSWCRLTLSWGIFDLLGSFLIR